MDTLNKEEENKNKGLIISFLLHVLILLCFLIPIMNTTPAIIEEPGGILIAFGEPDAGQNAEPAESEDVASTKLPEKAISTPKSNAEDISSSDREEEAPVKVSVKKSTTNPKPKSESTVKAQNDAKADSERKAREAAEKALLEKEAADKAKYAAQKNKYSDQLKKGQGNKGNSGNQGDPNGDPDGKVLEGISKGTGKVGGGLSGRGVEYEPAFTDNSQKTGKVSLSICVNNTGKVSKAEFTQKGSTTSDAYLIELARKTALKYKFSKSEIDSQCGTVTIDFRVK